MFVCFVKICMFFIIDDVFFRYFNKLIFIYFILLFGSYLKNNQNLCMIMFFVYMEQLGKVYWYDKFLLVNYKFCGDMVQIIQELCVYKCIYMYLFLVFI